MSSAVLSAVLVAVVLAAPSLTSPVERELKKIAKRNARPCYVEGQYYTDGETFNYPGFSRCVVYQCLDGRYTVAQSACEWNGRCVAEGSVYTESCRSLRCTQVSSGSGNVQYLQMEPTLEDKCKVEGRCVRKNVPFQHSSCQTFTCVPLGRGGYEFRPVGPRGCRDEINNSCVDVNTSFAAWVNGLYYNNCVCQIGGGYQCNG